MTRLDDLDALAAAATPGPWKQGPAGRGIQDNSRFVYIKETPFIQADRRDDAAFLAACDPTTIRKLIVVVRAARNRMEAEKRNGPFALPHASECALERHEHTGNRYDAHGKYLGGFVADHECPPCDCGAEALHAALEEIEK